MRYYLFYYTWSNKRMATSGDGNLFIEFDVLPSNKQLKQQVKKVIPKGSTVVIAGWSEFSSKEDYENFRG